jgi:hypothetical protein
VGYAGAVLSAYAGYKVIATWEHSASEGNERTPINAWISFPLTTMAISACYHWTANGHEATFWRYWPRTVPGAIIGFGIFRGVIGLICPPDRSIEGAYIDFKEQSKRDNRIKVWLSSIHIFLI